MVVVVVVVRLAGFDFWGEEKHQTVSNSRPSAPTRPTLRRDPPRLAHRLVQGRATPAGRVRRSSPLCFVFLV